MKMTRFLLFLFVMPLIVSIAGCGTKEKNASDGKIIAKINNYELTSDDFKEEARFALSGRYVSLDSESAKEALLGEIIIKNIMIQEAQAANFDKDKAFMKEIERYWEQALLKTLIKKKTDEFAAKMTVTKAEIDKEYERLCKECGTEAIGPLEKNSKRIRKDIRDRKIQKMLEMWVDDLKKRASVKIYKDNLNQVEVR